jgi:hypothetical protein
VSWTRGTINRSDEPETSQVPPIRQSSGAILRLAASWSRIVASGSLAVLACEAPGFDGDRTFRGLRAWTVRFMIANNPDSSTDSDAPVLCDASSPRWSMLLQAAGHKVSGEMCEGPSSSLTCAKLEAIHPVVFGQDYVPRPVARDCLKVNLDRANSRVTRYAGLYRQALRCNSDPAFRAIPSKGEEMDYFCGSEPIRDVDVQSPFRRRLRRLRRTLGEGLHLPGRC